MPSNADDENVFSTAHLMDDLRGRSVRGGVATVGAQLIRHFVIGLVATAILARLLTPSEFGLLAMVAALTNFLARFKDLGLGMATVQRSEITHDQVSTLFWLNVALGVVTTLLMAAFAPLVAWFYGEPRLTMITLVLAVAFMFGGLTVQHQALLRRQMRFTALAGLQIVAPALGAIAGIVSALLGAGYWALVVLQLTAAVVSTIGVWAVCGWRPGKPVRGAGVRSMLAFGGNLTGFNIVNYCVRELDNILIGWRWGSEALGLYSKAYQLLLLPIRQINAPLTGVAVPALSRLQSDLAQYVAYYKRAIELLTFVGMPLVAFTFVAADKVVLLILGDQWTDAVPIFRVLSPAAFIGTFNVATGWVYVSLGQTNRQLRWGALTALVTVVAFFVGLQWGPIGVAGAVSTVTVAIRYPAIVYCFLRSPLHVRDLAGAIWRPAVASVLAGGMALGTAMLFVSDTHLVLGLAIDLILYAAAYIVAWSVLPGGRPMLRDLRRLAVEIVHRDQKDEEV